MDYAPDAALSAAAAAGQPEAQYRLGAEYFAMGDIRSALTWLTRAADQQWPDAQNLLGIIYVNGIGVPCQPAAAVELFTAAAQADFKEAHFNLSALLFSGSTAQPDDSAALRHLLRAAELGHRPAWRVLGCLYGLELSVTSQQRAIRCFARAVVLGDAHAEYMLGLHFLQGLGVASDLGAARHWLASAASKKIYCAPGKLQSLISTFGDVHIQTSLRDYRNQAGLLAAAPLDTVPPKIRVEAACKPLSVIGAVDECHGLFDELLCDYLINVAASYMQPSGVVDPASGKPLQSNLRTSSSMNFQLSMYDMVVGLACRRLATLTGRPTTHAEPLSVLRYLPGQEYKPHYDHFAVDEHGAPRVQDSNGQRIATVFVYLNDVEEGGATDFPRLGKRTQPAKGKAVAFLNCNASGQPNLDMLHAGMPVVHGEKWLATLWFREHPFIWV